MIVELALNLDKSIDSRSVLPTSYRASHGSAVMRFFEMFFPEVLPVRV